MADVPSRARWPWHLRVIVLVVCLVAGGGIAGAVFMLAKGYQRAVEQSAMDREAGHFHGLLDKVRMYLTDGGRFASDLSGLLQVPSGGEGRTWEYTFIRATPAEVERLKALAAKDPMALTAEEVAFVTGILDVTYHAAGLPYDVPLPDVPPGGGVLVISRKLPSGDYRLGFSSGRVLVEPAGAASKSVRASNEVRKKAGLREISLK